MKQPIKIRGHHISCIPRFYHGGYDKTFAKNMKEICMQIRKNPTPNQDTPMQKITDLLSAAEEITTAEVPEEKKD